MKKKKKQYGGLMDSKFYRIYFIALAVSLIAIAIGMLWLNGVVRDYETAQPVHAAEVVAALFEDADYESIYAFDTSAQDISGGDEAFYVDSLNELSQGKAVAWRESFSSDPDERRYTVTLDGDKFATFTLVPSGETTGHGNRLWKLGSVTTHVALQGTEEAGDPAAAPYRVTVPAGFSVTVNGAVLTEADVVAPATSIYPEGFLPSGVTGPELVEYGFFSDEGEPRITVTDASGAAQTVSVDAENGYSYSCPIPEDEEAREQFSEAVLKLGERIAKYTVDDLARERIGIAPDSPAETILKKFSNSWAPSHKSTSVLNPQVSEFHVLSDDCITCHVSFDFVLTSRRQNDYTYPTSYTLCIVKRKGTGALYNIVFH
ncbi:MAG: hypothetical protein IJ769_05170 [Clostridia bacterium]|nr:hypothetical protein [Clostridia bacterium]